MTTVYATGSKMIIQKAPHIIERERIERERAIQTQENSKENTQNKKTKPCIFFNNGGGCRNGDLCTFLHSEKISEKVEMKNPKYKTKPCSFFNNGGCYFGDSCNFLHNEQPKEQVVEPNEQPKEQVVEPKEVNEVVEPKEVKEQVVEQPNEVVEEKVIDENEQKQQYGEKLFLMIKEMIKDKYQPIACKITGMFIEMSIDELDEVVSNADMFEKRFEEATRALVNDNMSTVSTDISRSTSPSEMISLLSYTPTLSNSSTDILTPLLDLDSQHLHLMLNLEETFPEESDLILESDEAPLNETITIDTEAIAMQIANKQLISECVTACQKMLDKVGDELPYVTSSKKFVIGQFDTKENMSVDGFMFQKSSLYMNRSGFQTQLKKELSSMCPLGYFSVNFDHNMAEEMLITARKRNTTQSPVRFLNL